MNTPSSLHGNGNRESDSDSTGTADALSSVPSTNASLPGDTLLRLAAVIEQRRQADPDRSYVARLFHKGTDAILKKIGEEATEVVMAGKDGDAQRLVGEMADLWFHSMVALAHFGLTPTQVTDELARREGLSGLEEFALRKANERQKHEAGTAS